MYHLDDIGCVCVPCGGHTEHESIQNRFSRMCSIECGRDEDTDDIGSTFGHGCQLTVLLPKIGLQHKGDWECFVGYLNPLGREQINPRCQSRERMAEKPCLIP